MSKFSPARRIVLGFALGWAGLNFWYGGPAVASEATGPVEQLHAGLIAIMKAGRAISFRQRYEMIIIDSPPILPVPDALILGQWTDGALLAARYDVSRSPQVERARRQLDNAGIPLLGTVINAMRSSDSYYGRYTYNRPRAPQADPAPAVRSPEVHSGHPGQE